MRWLSCENRWQCGYISWLIRFAAVEESFHTWISPKGRVRGRRGAEDARRRTNNRNLLSNKLFVAQPQIAWIHMYIYTNTHYVYFCAAKYSVLQFMLILDSTSLMRKEFVVWLWGISFTLFEKCLCVLSHLEAEIRLCGRTTCIHID